MHWDIDAKSSRSHTLDELHSMFQNLLVDEFQLRFHKEQKEGPRGEALGKRVPTDYLCWWLAPRIDRDERPVINETGLDGFYDFTLSYLPDLPPGYDMSKLPPGMSDWPSIFTALREQLGLKLEAKKGPIKFYVIDTAQKPSLN